MARFRSGPDGISVTLRDDERAGLAAVLEQFRQLLVGGKDRLEAIDTVEAGLDGVPLDDDCVSAWMQTLNSVRLYLGNTLEVGAATFNPPEEGDQPQEAARYVLYEWLGSLLDQLVAVAAESLPPGADD